MKNHWLMLRQLDIQLSGWQSIRTNRPRGGWVKTIRQALSMSLTQLADRLGLSRARIAQLEHAEMNDAVTLRALREAAHAMECDLVYAIVPKANSSLEEIIKARAQEIANASVSSVAHSMSLEEQSVDTNVLSSQRDELIRILTDHLNKKFWSMPVNEKKKTNFDDELAEAIYKQMQHDAQRELFFKNIDNKQFTELLIKSLPHIKPANIKSTADLKTKLHDPQYLTALKQSLINIQHEKETEKKQQEERYKKLMENLQKKK